MKFLNDFYKYISKITTIDQKIISLAFSTFFVLLVFYVIKKLGRIFINKKTEGKTEFFFNQSFKVVVNFIEIIVLISVWADSIRSLVTLISVISAAMTIALRDMILNFFCGIYIKSKKPFKVEDRIEIDELRGDVMNISLLDFEVLEVSTKEENGQSTGIVVTFPNSIVLIKPVKNITKGFKYIWNELVVKIKYDSDLVKNKKNLYKIINNIETIKNIPIKMKSQIKGMTAESRIYFNKYDPMIYTKIVDDHVELTVRYLMHPKKARYVESVIWNKIYLANKEGEIDLYLGKE